MPKDFFGQVIRAKVPMNYYIQVESASILIMLGNSAAEMNSISSLDQLTMHISLLTSS